VPSKLIRLASENGLSVEFVRFVEGGATEKLRKRFWFVNLVFCAVNLFVRIISFGKLESLLLDNCAVILKKRTAASERDRACLEEQVERGTGR
jgi:hypothetical protein